MSRRDAYCEVAEIFWITDVNFFCRAPEHRLLTTGCGDHPIDQGMARDTIMKASEIEVVTSDKVVTRTGNINPQVEKD
jgi:hypothetical protein